MTKQRKPIQKKGRTVNNKGRIVITIDEIVGEISQMPRAKVEKRIKNFKGGFTLDFTEKYLKSRSVAQLRHILLAAMTQSIRKSRKKAQKTL